MNYSYCATCRAEVQDTGGFCLLGHRLAGPVASLGELRAEVDQAFDVARSRVAEVLRTPPPAPPRIIPPPAPEPVTQEAAAPPAASPPATAAEHPPSRHLAPTSSHDAFFDSGGGAHAAPDSPERASNGNGRAQAAEAGDDPLPGSQGVEALWGAASVDRPGEHHDPITAFAPVPSMDWGPDRPARKRLRKGKTSQ